MLITMQTDPIAAAPAITQTPAVGPRNQTDIADAKATAPTKANADDLKLSFPPDHASDIEEALRTVDEAVKPYNIALNFSRDVETGTIVIKLVDQTTGETVSQIPPEVRLHLTASLGKLQGQLINRTA